MSADSPVRIPFTRSLIVLGRLAVEQSLYMLWRLQTYRLYLLRMRCLVIERDTITLLATGAIPAKPIPVQSLLSDTNEKIEHAMRDVNQLLHKHIN